MTDPLDDLKRAFDHATPEPDAERRKANLARAMELFDQPQESAGEPRRTHDRHQFRAAIGHGVRHMLSALTSRPALAAAAGLTAVGLALVFVILSRDAAPPSGTVVAEVGAVGEEEATPSGHPAEESRVTEPATEVGAVAEGPGGAQTDRSLLAAPTEEEGMPLDCPGDAKRTDSAGSARSGGGAHSARSGAGCGASGRQVPESRVFRDHCGLGRAERTLACRAGVPAGQR